MKKIIQVIILCILSLLVLNLVNAIGISPSRVTINFEPNLQETYNYNVINWEYPTEIKFYVKGELAEYINLPETTTSLKKNEIKTFNIEINLPSEIEKPGLYDTRIGVVEYTDSLKGATVGAVTGVESQFVILVPYPGKYITASLEIDNTNVNKETDILINVQNLGQEDLNQVNAQITIYDTNGSIVTKLNSNTISIKSKESGSLSTTWIPTNIGAGQYLAKAIIAFDGESSETERYFQIGDLLMEIMDISPLIFNQGEINKIEIKLKSLWNEKISDIYAELIILDQNSEIVSVKTETIEVNPWVEKKIYGYLDFEDITEGEYILKTILHFSDKTIEKEVKIQVVKNNLIFFIIIIIVIILLILTILIYVIWRKKKK